MLDDLDKELAQRQHRFVRYADDCNVYVRSRRAGQRVMDSLERFLQEKLRLKVSRRAAFGPEGAAVSGSDTGRASKALT